MLAPADITEIEAGLWRWTARHPDWVPGAPKGSAGDWPPEVGSVAYVAEGTLLLVDPLVPDEAEALWQWLDARAGDCAGGVAVVNTIKWHRRSRDEVAARFGATTSHARASLPRGVEPISIRGAGETMFWLPAPAALVCGDRLLGNGRGGLRMCPESWLRYLGRTIGHAELREALAPLLELPIERVLVSHGAPVLRRGSEALAVALEP